MGVFAGMPRRGKTQGFAMLETARDLPDATLISRVYFQRGLTPTVSRAARSEASGGHQPGTGWRRLDQPVRLGSEGRVLHFTCESATFVRDDFR